jgi:hypothetical protein
MSGAWPREHARLVICNAERLPERMLGVEELSALIDARPDLRRRLRSLLGLRDLGPLLDAGAVERGSLDVEGACELARVFVPTRAVTPARPLRRATVWSARKWSLREWSLREWSLREWSLWRGSG